MGTSGKPFSAEIENPRASEDPFIADPVLEGVAASLVARGPSLRSESAARYLKVKQERGKVALTEIREIERRYRLLFLEDPDVLRRVMPIIHQVLADYRAECSDCPGPTRFVADAISRGEILVSIARRAIPVYEVRPDGFSPRLSDREFFSNEAAFRVLRENEKAQEQVDRMLEHQVRTLVFQKEQQEQARAELRRRHLVGALEQDEEFFIAIRPTLQKLAQIGIVCGDCN